MAAAREGLRLVPASELSALDGDREDLHVLAYGIDHRDPGLCDALHRWRRDRAARGTRMAAAMGELGWAVEVPDRGDKPLGRPHLAQAIFDHPDNRMRLRREGLVNFSQLLESYLIPGRPSGLSPRSGTSTAQPSSAIAAAIRVPRAARSRRQR